MPLRARISRRMIVAVLAFFALQAGLAAGPIRARADGGSNSRPVAASTPGPTAGPAAPGGASAGPATPVAAPAAPAPVPSSLAALVPGDRLYLQPVLEQAAAENGLPRDLVL